MFITPEQFERISKWKYKKILLYAFLSLLFAGGISVWKVFIENRTENNVQKNKVSIENNNISMTVPKVLGEDDVKNNNEQIIEKEFNEGDWEIDKKRIEREVDGNGRYNGFLCVKDSKVFDSAIISYKEKIPLDTTLKLRYTLKNKSNFNGSVSKLIFSFGDESNFRIFLPEDSMNEFIGIEKIDANKAKVRKHIRLVNKIDSSKENIFEITVKNPSVNKASFLYNLKYFPLFENSVNEEVIIKQVFDSDNFEEYLPWVDPGNIGFKQAAGVGVFNNVCIKITSATWSNDK